MFPQWRGTEFSLGSIGVSTITNSGLALLNSFRTEGWRMFSRTALRETGALVAQGFSKATVATGSAFDGFTIAGGAVTGDETLVGRGLAGLGGSLAGVGIAAMLVPVAAPAAGIIMGCSFMAGGLAGNLLRDYSRTVNHVTDDVVGQGIIDHTPDAIKRPGARIYNDVITEGENIVRDPLGEARRAIDAVGNWFGGHPVAHTAHAPHAAPAHTPAHITPRHTAQV